MIEMTSMLSQKVGILPACQATGLARSSLYRWKKGPQERVKRQRQKPERTITESERAQILSILNSERFCDLAPRQVYATLLDEGAYHCSWRSMYRILAQKNQVHERRRQRRAHRYEKPELLATSANTLWTWDITKLKGPGIWQYYYLYVIIDVFSRYVPGFMVAERESAELAKELIEISCQRQRIGPEQLTLHSDRGPAMKAKSVALLLSDLGVKKSHSRPHVSNDNPFSEAQFKTVKYHPSFPDRFGSLQDVRAWVQDFFDWYNNHHRHSSLGLMTPYMVHYGKAERVREQRKQVLETAYRVHPERFVRGISDPEPLPQAVWINPPNNKKEDTQTLH
jgi:putative transposase|tara:strand:+ start:505 stop:1518 length:1014 start_codon:yes stop_codon:yes gene_type:complete